MPQADTAYLIGVIREWEKGLLEDDEFTRLIEADNYEESLRTLVDTPYGKWIEGDPSQSSALKALNRELKELYEWITESVTDERVAAFISAIYDAMNCGSALLKFHEGADDMGQLSELGSISAEEWQSAIWNNMGWKDMAQPWQDTGRALMSEKSPTVILKKVGQSLREQLNTLAFTPLMKEVCELWDWRLERDEQNRPWQSDDKASAYEKEADEKMLAIVRKYRHEPVGFDPVLAYWYAKEMEVRQLRLLLSIKRAGLSVNILRELKRSRFLETV